MYVMDIYCTLCITDDKVCGCGCRIKSNCPHMGTGIIGDVLYIDLTRIYATFGENQ